MSRKQKKHEETNSESDEEGKPVNLYQAATGRDASSSYERQFASNTGDFSQSSRRLKKPRLLPI